MKYECPKCLKSFKNRSGILYHKKHNVCDIEPEPILRCNSCNKIFNRAYNLKRHIEKKHMSKTITITNNIEKRLDAYEENMQHMSEQFKENMQTFSEQLNNINNNINNFRNSQNKQVDMQTKHIGMQNSTNNGMINLDSNNTAIDKFKMDNSVTNNNVTNNFNIVKFGAEDLSKLTKEEMQEIFCSGFTSSIVLTEKLHFNNRLPEYHNVMIHDLKSKYGKFYDGEKWVVQHKHELIDKLYDDKKECVEKLTQTLTYRSMRPCYKTNIKRFLDMNESEACNQDKVKEIKGKLSCSLFNNKQMVLNRIKAK